MSQRVWGLGLFIVPSVLVLVGTLTIIQSKLTFGGISVGMSLGGVFLGAGVCLSWEDRVFRTKWCGLSAYAFVHLLVGNPTCQIPENIGCQRRLGWCVIVIEMAVTYLQRFVFGD